MILLLTRIWAITLRYFLKFTMFIMRKVNHHDVLNEINKYLLMILKHFFPFETFSQFMVCNAYKLIILVNTISFKNQGEV